MKNFLSSCWDFIISMFVFFIFFVCIIVAFAVCYTFHNIGIISGVAALAVTILLKFTEKKSK